MKLSAKNPLASRSAATGVLVFALAACGQEPPPKPAAKAAPPAAPAAPKAEMKAEPAKPAAVESVQASADKTLAERVKAALLEERSLKAHGIDIVAKDGVVTLFGTTETRLRREMAGKIAAGVQGVKSVENKLAVVAGS